MHSHIPTPHISQPIHISHSLALVLVLALPGLPAGSLRTTSCLALGTHRMYTLVLVLEFRLKGKRVVVATDVTHLLICTACRVVRWLNLMQVEHSA